ncbi:MAG: hypothetical protein AAF845_07960 [Bacteroidota bacterium]
MRLFTLAALLVLVAGCDATDDRLGADVTLLGLDGTVVTTGTLTFDAPVAAGETVSGTYRLGVSPDGVIETTGDLEASCEVGPKERDDFVVTLGTDVADAGVSLYGTCADGPGGGQWVRLTIGGDVPAGTFALE